LVSKAGVEKISENRRKLLRAFLSQLHDASSDDVKSTILELIRQWRVRAKESNPPNVDDRFARLLDFTDASSSSSEEEGESESSSSEPVDSRFLSLILSGFQEEEEDSGENQEDAASP
jgi:hypothetical protein